MSVVTLPADGCSALRHPSGILSSHVTEVTGCGVADLPWVIEVGLGQRINVTLYDFEFGVALPGSEEDRSGYAKSCRVYAIIRDTGERPGQTRTVCGGMERAVNAFVSSSQKIEIRILTKSNVKPSPQNPGPHFLLHYSGKCLRRCATKISYSNFIISKEPSEQLNMNNNNNNNNEIR